MGKWVLRSGGTGSRFWKEHQDTGDGRIGEVGWVLRWAVVAPGHMHLGIPLQLLSLLSTAAAPACLA